MSSEEQAAAYLHEAELTLASARAIYESADESGANLWAQVVKNGYDAIEQAVSAGIADASESVPRRHPAKVTTFVDRYEPPAEMEETLLYWLGQRSDSQYVDVRGNDVNVPHRRFGQDDAERILDDAEAVIDFVDRETNCR